MEETFTIIRFMEEAVLRMSKPPKLLQTQAKPAIYYIYPYLSSNLLSPSLVS
jgi:hypothetical protein